MMFDMLIKSNDHTIVRSIYILGISGILNICNSLYTYNIYTYTVFDSYTNTHMRICSK